MDYTEQFETISEQLATIIEQNNQVNQYLSVIQNDLSLIGKLFIIGLVMTVLYKIISGILTPVIID